AVRGDAQIPLRDWREGAEPVTRTKRIPLSEPRPHAPDGFVPKAFAGEVIPFRIVAFREGHDHIGTQLRLYAPDGAASLHRMLPLDDGTDRWEARLAIDAPGS